MEKLSLMLNPIVITTQIVITSMIIAIIVLRKVTRIHILTHMNMVIMPDIVMVRMTDMDTAMIMEKAVFAR
ncbi:hypothetical protein D3C77_796400 [compost metagenome]